MLNADRSDTYPYFEVVFKYTKKFLAVDTIDVIGLYIFVQIYTNIFTTFTCTLTTFVFIQILNGDENYLPFHSWRNFAMKKN